MLVKPHKVRKLNALPEVSLASLQYTAGSVRISTQLSDMYTSSWPTLDIPKCNLLSYLFPDGATASDKPIWRNAQDPEHCLSAVQTLSLIKRIAIGLDKLGVATQQVVLTFTPNHIYVPAVYLATAGSKRCFTGVSPAYTAREVAHQMKAVEPAVVLIHDTLLETGIAAATEANIPLDRLFVFSESPEVQHPMHSIRDWRSILASVEESKTWSWDPLEGDIAARTVAVVNFSSGTTGLPKGVCITHHNLVANSVQAIFCRYQTTMDARTHQNSERWLAFLPLYHAYSQLFTINIALKLRISVYVLTKFSFEGLLDSVQRYRITTIQAVPPLLVMLAKRPETANYDLRSLEYILSGGAPLAKDLQNEVARRFNLVVAQGFGMSETTCCAFVTPGLVADTSGSIGNLLPNTGTSVEPPRLSRVRDITDCKLSAEACLLDEYDHEVTQEGQPGELCLRGPQMMLEYWKNEQATKETIDPSGWLRTGDVAVTKGGRWWIVDRRKELIKVNVGHSSDTGVAEHKLTHSGPSSRTCRAGSCATRIPCYCRCSSRWNHHPWRRTSSSVCCAAAWLSR